MNKYSFSAMACAALALMILSCAPAHAYPGQKQYAAEAKISLKEAEKIAMKAFPGKIVARELEKERGGSGLRYTFDIGNGTAVHEVGVDAKTGAVLENSVESKSDKDQDSSNLKPPIVTISLPGGTNGIDFDDMSYFPQLGRVALPAAQTGDLDLINPQTYAVTVIPDVASKQAAAHGDDRGSTSVAYGEGFLFAGDHGRVSVAIVDPGSKRIVGHVKLAANYDYIRYVPSRHELWVTEPRQHRIEIFEQVGATPPAFKHETFITVPGGPESLVFDRTAGRAYTNSWSGSTLAISLSQHHVVHRWPDGCRQSRGLARDGHYLFVACKEGAIAVLNTVQNGKVVGKTKVGQGVDSIAYDSDSHRLFVPAAKSATVTVLRAAANGKLHRVAVYRSAKGAHCVAAAGNGRVFVCDPEHGRILVIGHAGGD